MNLQGRINIMITQAKINKSKHVTIPVSLLKEIHTELVNIARGPSAVNAPPPMNQESKVPPAEVPVEEQKSQVVILDGGDGFK